ncbi:MAG: hypothetical protein CM15mV11_1460 [Caudoviricetes sp.]|nr:MAG: hypothetical protein CM15mV11_1460 [Caudoviricetes sp.]
MITIVGDQSGLGHRWIFAEVPDAVRSELETCINEKGDDARNTLGGHLEQSWHIPIKEHTKSFHKRFKLELY